MTESFGDFVKNRRKQLRLTQRVVAQALGMSSIAFVSEVEAGTRRLAETHWPKLAEILETSVEELASRDVKAPIQEARRLVARNPDYAVVFRRVLEQSKHLSAEEILRQMDSGEQKKSDP